MRKMDPGRVSRSQELSKLGSGLGLRVGGFKGRKEAFKGWEERSFRGKRERKLPREGRKEAS